MAKLIYSAIASLDGYVADKDGNFDWAAPDEEVHAFVNDLMRPVGTYLFGRCTYEVMVAWETMVTLGQPPVVQDFSRIWKTANKVVFSKRLRTVRSANTRIERQFQPEAIRKLKAAASRDIFIGGPGLAAQAFHAGLIDDCHLFLVPAVVGEGTRALPGDLRMKLELVEGGYFENGTIHVHYRPKPDEAGLDRVPESAAGSG